MKKNILILFTILLGSTIALSASAQEKLKLELGYNIGSPLGSFKNDFINQTSFRGATGELSYTFNPAFSLGLHSGFQSYYQKYPRNVYKLDGNQTVSAVLSNTMNIVPLVLRGTYSPLGMSAAKIQPYISAGAGVSLVTYGQYLGEFGGVQSSSPFTVEGGAGIKIPFGHSYNQTAFKIGATYNYINYKQNNLSNLSTIGYSAGVVFGLR